MSDIFSDVLPPASNVHKYNTARSPNFFRPSVSTNIGTATYRFSGSKIWESISSICSLELSLVLDFYMSQSGLAGKFRQGYYVYCLRVMLISTEEHIFT